jgi:hypothetical protein
VNEQGYEPAKVTLRAGVPARLASYIAIRFAIRKPS